MSNVYIIKVVKYGQVIQRKQINTGMRKGVPATVLKAEPNVTYVLQSLDSDNPIAKIITQRVGQNLHLTVEDGDIRQPQVVIENFAEFESSTAFATTLKLGGLSYFNAESDSAFSLSSWGLESGITTLVAPGAQSAGFMSPLAWAGAGTAVAVAAKSSSKSESTDATTAATEAAQNKVVAYAQATNTSTITPLQTSDYSAAGLTGVNTSNVDAINSAISRVHSSNMADIKTVLAAYLKIMAKANGTDADTTNNDPTLADYQALGIKLLGAETATTAYPLNLLNDIIKARTPTDINTVTKLDGYAAMADKLMLTAKGNLPTTPLSVADLNSIGLSDINSNNLGAFLSAVEASANSGEGIDMLQELKNISTAYLKILALADGIKTNTTEQSKTPTLADYLTIGVSAGKATNSSQAQQAAALKLLNDTVDGLSNSAVDTIAEINALGASIDKLMAVCIASDHAAALAIGLTATELAAMGITGVTADNLGAVTEAIRITQSSNGSAIDTLKELQSAADLGVIMNYADTSNGASAHIAPTLAQYLSAGLPAIDSSSNKAITSTNLAAINTAVDALSSSQVNSVAGIQSVLNAYGKAFAQADGVKANTQASAKLLLSDYTSLGALSHFDAVTGLTNGNTSAKAMGQATDDQHVSALNLLTDVIDGRNASQVDSVAEINLLSVATDKVIDLAAHRTPSSDLTVADLNAMGVNSANTDNLSQIVSNIQNTYDTGNTNSASVDSLSEIQSLVSVAVAQVYAGDGSKAAPTLQDYKDLNLSDVTWNETLRSAVNTVVNALNTSDISQIKLSGIASAYQSILNEATNGITNTNTDPTAAQYEAVLLNTGHAFHGAANATTHTSVASNALALMNDVVAHKAAANLSSINALETMANNVDHLISLATGGTSTTTLAELSALGFNTNGWSDTYNSTKINKITQLIAATDDSGVNAIHSWQQVQDIINASAVFSA